MLVRGRIAVAERIVAISSINSGVDSRVKENLRLPSGRASRSREESTRAFLNSSRSPEPRAIERAKEAAAEEYDVPRHHLSGAVPRLINPGVELQSQVAGGMGGVLPSIRVRSASARRAFPAKVLRFDCNAICYKQAALMSVWSLQLLN
jgi:hypothetical protein